MRTQHHNTLHTPCYVATQELFLEIQCKCPWGFIMNVVRRHQCIIMMCMYPCVYIYEFFLIGIIRQTYCHYDMSYGVVR